MAGKPPRSRGNSQGLNTTTQIFRNEPSSNGDAAQIDALSRLIVELQGSLSSFSTRVSALEASGRDTLPEGGQVIEVMGPAISADSKVIRFTVIRLFQNKNGTLIVVGEGPGDTVQFPAS